MQHKAKPGIRSAFICDHKAHDTPLRKFTRPGDPTPRCTDHGVMKRQPNQPYCGQSTS